MREIAHCRDQVVAEATVGMKKQSLDALIDTLLEIKSNLSGREPAAEPLAPAAAVASAG
jgi:hypothetical protein